MRHKELLEEIRAERAPEGDANEPGARRPLSSIRHAQSGNTGHVSDQGINQGTIGPAGGGYREGGEIGGTSEGRDWGVRPPEWSALDADQSGDPAPGGYEELDAPVQPERRLTRAERRARNKELARQRQARYRARQNALDGDAVSFNDVGIDADLSSKSVTSQPGVTQNGDVTRVPTGDASNAVFRWKNPLKKDKAPAKLFSKKEAEDRQERMAEIFMRMTGLMDQVLEIIVRGHEEVTIWQMSDDEATMFAESLLTQAQASHESAATARKLLDMYDRLYMYAWAGPRLVATGRHIKKQGGFGWR